MTNTAINSWGLKYWETGEYQVIEEKVEDIQKSGLQISPLKLSMVKLPLKETPYERVSVAIFGQDPYPNPEHSTGIAFSVPEGIKVLPPTLKNIFTEYQNDLHYPEPSSGSLLKWCHEGVLLWNVIPTCTAYKSLSHVEWTEWHYLTQEIIRRLAEKECLMVFLGGIAKGFAPADCHACLYYSHPSPRGALSGRTPFLGSRIFTTINVELAKKGVEKIDWRLP